MDRYCEYAPPPKRVSLISRHPDKGFMNDVVLRIEDANGLFFRLHVASDASVASRLAKATIQRGVPEKILTVPSDFINTIVIASVFRDTDPGILRSMLVAEQVPDDNYWD